MAGRPKKVESTGAEAPVIEPEKEEIQVEVEESIVKPEEPEVEEAPEMKFEVEVSELEKEEIEEAKVEEPKHPKECKGCKIHFNTAPCKSCVVFRSVKK